MTRRPDPTEADPLDPAEPSNDPNVPAESVTDRASLSRRAFLKGGAVAGVTSAVAAAARAEAASGSPATPVFRGPRRIELTINGKAREVEVEGRTTLLQLLRERLTPPLTGAKLVCDGGNCGACTVLLDDEPVASCMTLAVDAAGRSVRTVEALGSPGKLSDLQQAFCDRDGMMCGFCTPGFVVSLTHELERNPAATETELRDACAGNLCRCGTYPQVFAAALDVAREPKKEAGL